jgi:site-specific DNA recombinase
MIFCGGCGEVFRRVHWNNRGKKSVVWRCVSRLENTGLFCDARTVPENTLEQLIVTAINQALCDKDHFLITLQKISKPLFVTKTVIPLPQSINGL